MADFLKKIWQLLGGSQYISPQVFYFYFFILINNLKIFVKPFLEDWPVPGQDKTVPNQGGGKQLMSAVENQYGGEQLLSAVGNQYGGEKLMSAIGNQYGGQQLLTAEENQYGGQQLLSEMSSLPPDDSFVIYEELPGSTRYVYE